MAAIKKIASIAADDPERRQAEDLERALRGKAIVEKLLALAEQGPQGRVAAAAGWKARLEDFGSKDPGESGDGPAVWAALRIHFGGVVRVPYGNVAEGEVPRDVVLVASKGLVMRVFRDPDDLYSMRGQMERMKRSFGPIFLGLDGGAEYDEKSRINDVIMTIGEDQAFELAYKAASGWLENVLRIFCGLYGPEDEKTESGRAGELDLRRDFITPTLALICNFWFGIPDTADIDPEDFITSDSLGLNPAGPHAEPGKVVDEGKPPHVYPGGWSWRPGHKPRCPGDFLATSRYCFYPDPVPRVRAYGQAQGQALRQAVRAHFEQLAAEETKVQAKVAAPLREQFKDDTDELARTLIGVMTGFLPPADASLRWTLYEWLEEKLFWRIQHELVAASGKPSYERAASVLKDPLMRAMQKRPSPDMLWRTAARGHRLGGVDVEEGDRIFVGIVSAMAEDVTAGVTEVYPVFGGDRREEAHPRHACPAYRFAMGTMIGVMAALMEKVRVEALPSPLLVKISDLSPCPSLPPGPSPVSCPTPPEQD